MRSLGRGSHVLVTGGAGFVGARLARRLRDEGFVVRVLDDLSTGQRERLEGVEVELVVGDVRSERSVREAIAGMDAVIHLATASPAGGPREERLAHDVNVTGTLNLLLAAVREKVARFILGSSSAVYGARVPYLLHEDMPPKPTNAIGAHKAAAEGYARLFGDRDGLPATILRIFGLYGPERTDGVVAHFIAAAKAGEGATIQGDGMQTRDLLYIDDAVNAIFLALVTPNAAGRTLNVASGESVAIRHVASLVADLFGGLPAPRYMAAPHNDSRDLRASVAAAASVLGFRTRVRLREGLAACAGNIVLPTQAALPPAPRRMSEGEPKVRTVPPAGRPTTVPPRGRPATVPPPIPWAATQPPKGPPPPPPAAVRSAPLFGNRPAASFVVDEDDLAFAMTPEDDDDVLITSVKSSEAWA